MISIEEVNRIAKLARLEFSDDEKPKLQKELSDILNYVDQLKEIENKTVEEDLDPQALNIMRQDTADQKENPQEFLSQSAGHDGKYIKVKSVLE